MIVVNLLLLFGVYVCFCPIASYVCGVYNSYNMDTCGVSDRDIRIHPYSPQVCSHCTLGA